MKIKIFTTGGSIDKTYSTLESDFVVGEPQAAALLADGNVTIEWEVETLLRKDSLEITPQEREEIARRVRADPHERIVITHGTDSMPQTAESLLGIPGKVIVLTGAMQPAAFKHSDASFNLGGAVIAAQTLPPGVYLVMNGRVFAAGAVAKNVAENRFEEQ